MKRRQLSWKITIWAVPLSVVLLEVSDWYFSYHCDTHSFWDHPAGKIVGDIILAVVMFSGAHWPLKEETAETRKHDV